MTIFYSYDSVPTVVSSGDELPEACTEITEATYDLAIAANQATADADNAAYAAAKYADAQTVYDDLLATHSDSALILARLVDPTFTP